LFINDIFQLGSIKAEIYLYADDTSIIFHANDNNQLQFIINDFFKKYSIWSNENCIVINPDKFNYLAFNHADIVLAINNQLVCQLKVVKFLGVYIDENLYWSHHVNYVYEQCCKRIGMFKRIISFLPRYVIPLYYHAFVRSCFSYCTVFLFNNNRSGKWKLTYKIDSFISFLAKHLRINSFEFVSSANIYNVDNVCSLQSLALMYDICNLNLVLPFFPVSTNTSVHIHETRSANNLHINTVTPLDTRNFLYHCTIKWNSCSLSTRLLTKSRFLRQCKSILLKI